ncbi:MAG TPA: hypothetical protein VNS58_06555 [Puia sp.]|nr:hypothetical protein [Puia sp.]
MKLSVSFAACSFAAVLLAGALSSSAQIQVSEEPRHHKVFENVWVRVLDVHIPPGDTSLMHKHSTPSVFIVLTNTKTGSQAIVEPAKMNLANGHIWFESFYDKPRIHRVWNSDTTEFHVIDMELPNKNPQSIDPPLDNKSFTLLFDEKPVRGYQLTLAAGGNVKVPSRKAPLLVVILTDGKVAVNDKDFVKKGDYLFIEAGKPVTIINKGMDQRLALFELK